MKKTLITLAGAVILLAIVLLLDKRRDAARQSGEFAFDTTAKAGVNYLKVTMQKDTIVVRKQEGKWAVSPDGFPADTGKINKNLSYLLGLQSKVVVSTSTTPERLAEYGLDSTQAKHVEWEGTKDGKVRVVLGKTSGIDYGSTYWKWEDKPEVYSTPGNFTWEIDSRPSDWKDKVLFNVDVKNLKSVQVNWRDGADAAHHYKLEVVNDTTYKLVEPPTPNVVKTVAQQIVAQCAQLSIDDFVARGDTNLSRIRLDTPMVAIKMEFKDGTSREVHGGRTFETFVYVQHPSRKDIVKLSSWRFDPFKKKVTDLAVVAGPTP